MKKILFGFLMASIIFCACSEDIGTEGAYGKNTKINIDSLADVLREEITGTLWDSLYAKPYIDTVYKTLFDNTFASKWMDSIRNALLDSLKESDYDSLYTKLYDSVYNDIYSQSVIKSLDAFVYHIKENINGAFANQYPLMYKDFTDDDGHDVIPLSIGVRNQCKQLTCSYKKVMLQAWIPGYTDTASITGTANPSDIAYLTPKFAFNKDALAKLTSPEKAQYEARAFALENDHKILFYSTSSPVTIHPMQVFGSEYAGVKNKHWWYNVWVTPNMDSIPQILKELSRALPDTTLKIYQKYSADTSIAQSSRRVVGEVFKLLQKRGIKYIQNGSLGSVGQKIQYPIETLREKKGVCIETTVLFLSILEAAGFQPFLVLLPSHSFVGWRSEKESKILDFIETTMITSANATPADAINSAIDRYNAEVEAGNFTSGKSELIDIEKTREHGIMPNDIH